MVDPDRILAALDGLEGYLRELRQIAPAGLQEYARIEIRRSCERLLQVCVESVIDICSQLVAGFRLGLPSDENDLFEKLEAAGHISVELKQRLRKMKAFRNILVHQYAQVDDRIVFGIVSERLGDFDEFADTIRDVLRGQQRA